MTTTTIQMTVNGGTTQTFTNESDFWAAYNAACDKSFTAKFRITKNGVKVFAECNPYTKTAKLSPMY